MRAPHFLRLLFVIAVTGAACCGPTAATVDPPGITVLGSGFSGRPFLLGGDLVAETDSLTETIRDYSDPLQPRVVGWLDHSQDCYWNDVVADGPLVVGLTGPQTAGILGFSVMEITDPRAPVYHGTFAGLTPDSGWLRGHALLTSTETLLLSYDLADPSAPALTSFVLAAAHAGSRCPVAVGNTLYLIEQGATLRALDVTDALHPATLALPALVGDRIDALAAGDGHLHALVAVDVGGAGERLDLVTCDVGAPGTAVETARRTLCAGAGVSGRALAGSGDLLVAATGDGQVRAFGLGDPGHPAAGWTAAHDCGRLVVSQSAIVLREGRDTVVYPRTPFDGALPAPHRRSPLPDLGNVVGQGPIQIVQYYWTGRYGTVDVSDPYWPRVSPPYEQYISGALQYKDHVGLDSALGPCRLYDLHDPVQPEPKGLVTWPYVTGRGRLLSSSLAAVEKLTAVGLRLVDITDLANPVLRGELPESAARAVGDGLLACGDQYGLRLYDISDLDAPVLRGSVTSPGSVTRAEIWHGHLYALAQRGSAWSLDTYDVTDPAAPLATASAALPLGMSRLDRFGRRLYVQGYNGFEVFDLTDAAAPTSFGFLRRYPSLTGFAVNGDLVTLQNDLVCVRNDGQTPASAPPPAAVAVTLDPAWPNPANPATTVSFAVDTERELALSVYDIRGRHVSDAARGRFTAGAHAVTWNGTDDGGAAVAAGVYLLRLHGAGVEAATTVTLIK